jgi:hypothetical protein
MEDVRYPNCSLVARPSVAAARSPVVDCNSYGYSMAMIADSRSRSHATSYSYRTHHIHTCIPPEKILVNSTYMSIGMWHEFMRYRLGFVVNGVEATEVTPIREYAHYLLPVELNRIIP